MKRLKFKKPFNGMMNAKRLIPESYKIDGNEFEITDGIETYRIKWSTSLNEGTVLMSSNKKLINEDVQKMKHLMGFKSQETIGTLKGKERIQENAKFGDIFNKSKKLISEMTGGYGFSNKGNLEDNQSIDYTMGNENDPNQLPNPPKELYIDDESLKEMDGDYDFPTTNNDSWKWEDRERMKHRIEAKFNNHNPRLKLINSEDHNRHSEFGNGNLVIVTNQSSPELEYKLQELASENEWGFESFLDGLYLMYQGNGYGNNNESLKEIHLEESDGEVDASVTNLMNYIKDTPKFGTLAGKINSPQKKIQAGVEYAKLVAGGDTALLSKIGSKIKAESGESDGQTNTDTSITNEGAFTNESEECNECGDMYEMDRFDEIFEGIYEEDEDFPDLTGDGKVTQADILKGRGVFEDEE